MQPSFILRKGINSFSQQKSSLFLIVFSFIPQIPLEISTRIRKTLTESRQGWTTKQVNDLIVNESGIHYHYTHVYRLLYKWGFKQNYHYHKSLSELHPYTNYRNITILFVYISSYKKCGYIPFLKIQSSSDFICFTKISISIGFSTK